MPTTTTRMAFSKPDIGQANWGAVLNTSLDAIDAAVAGVSVANTFTGANIFAADLTLSQTNAENLFINSTSHSPVIQLQRAATTKSRFGISDSASALCAGTVAGDLVIRAEGQKIFISADSGTTAAQTIDTSSNTTFGGLALIAAGAVSAPALAWVTHPDTGVYFSGTSSMRMASGGSNKLSIVSTGAELDAGAFNCIPGGSSSAPVVTVANNTALGLYGASNTVGLAAPTGGDIEMRINGVQVADLTGAECYIAKQIVVAPATSASAPDYSFNGDADTGMYRTQANEIGFATNGTARCAVSSAGNLYPLADNTYKCGVSGGRWSEVWAGNGTLQTSHSDFKYEIRHIDAPIIPRGAFFRWKDKRGTNDDRPWIGFIADPLPKEAFAWDENGEIIKTGVNLSSVVGELCAGWWTHEGRLKALEAKLAKAA